MGVTCEMKEVGEGSSILNGNEEVKREVEKM